MSEFKHSCDNLGSFLVLVRCSGLQEGTSPRGPRESKFDPLDNPAQGEVPVLHSFGSFTATDVARSRQIVPNSTVSSTVPPRKGEHMCRGAVRGTAPNGWVLGAPYGCRTQTLATVFTG